MTIEKQAQAYLEREGRYHPESPANARYSVRYGSRALFASDTYDLKAKLMHAMANKFMPYQAVTFQGRPAEVISKPVNNEQAEPASIMIRVVPGDPGSLREVPIEELSPLAGIYIWQDVAFTKLCEVEGDSFKRYEELHQKEESDYTFFGNKHAYRKLAYEFQQAGQRVEDDDGNTWGLIIYGNGGISRYRVRCTGEIVLLGNTCSAHLQEKARSAGFTVVT